MPVIGFINAASAQNYTRQLAAFHKGLAQAGYVNGQNVLIEYRWADDQNDRLPAMAADLLHRQVAVIAATSTPAAIAAKATTTTIPIVFEMGGNPVELGLVASLSRPGGNVTGVTGLNAEVAPKRLELLHELLPTVRVMALLVDPTDSTTASTTVNEVLTAARSFGLQLHVLHASSERDFEGVFSKLSQLGAGGLVVAGGPFFASHGEQLAAMALRHAVPVAFQRREFTTAGGLLSYGSDLTESYRLAGIYTGRILNGDKPADLPVQQATKVELYINLKTAKTFGITVPLTLSGRADEVIE
jgi:putative ABC transport system substrate-binding protein